MSRATRELARELAIARQPLHRMLADTAAVSRELAVLLARLCRKPGRFRPGLHLAHDLRPSPCAFAGSVGRILAAASPGSLKTETPTHHGRTP